MQQAGAFKVGDIIKIDPSSGYKGRASILAWRPSTMQRTHGYIADLLCEDGNVRGHYLHDIAKWNPDKLAATFKA